MSDIDMHENLFFVKNNRTVERMIREYMRIHAFKTVKSMK